MADNLSYVLMFCLLLDRKPSSCLEIINITTIAVVITIKSQQQYRTSL
jgi:hypothetical protein